MSEQHSVVIFFVAGTLLFMVFAFFIVYSFLIKKRSQYVHKLEKQQLEFDRQNEILRVKIEEQEHTFHAISKELHDNIKSKLGTTQMTLYRISDMGLNEKQNILLDRADKVIANVIGEVNNISRSLNGDFISHIGLTKAIEERLESVKTGSKINCLIQISGDPITLGSEKELDIFRIAQEVIQNCVKYAHAKNLSVHLDYQADVFTMKISDDGIGFEKKKIAEIQGLGFMNMYHRARHLDAMLEIETEPMKGCNVMLTVKVNTNETEDTTISPKARN